MVLNNLGLTLRNLGRAREASELLVEAARRREETYGSMHRSYVSALSLSGSAARTPGSCRQASRTPPGSLPRPSLPRLLCRRGTLQRRR